MKKRLLDLIACRGCGGDFKLTVDSKEGDEIMTGKLSCPKCHTEYTVLKGVPRFIKGMKTEADLRQVYADSFGHQWTTYNWLRDEDEYEFHAITDLTNDDLKGKMVFDAGCGGGRFSRIVAPQCGEYFGLDFSIAVDKAFELVGRRPNVNFIQCDINEQPFKPKSFDVVMSHGVIHHTPNTKQTFDNLPDLVKPGGTMYIAVFRESFIALRASDTAWRKALNKLPIPMMDKVCGAMSYLSYVPNPIFFKRFFWFSMQKTHEIRKCCLYDWYAPTYHHEHTVEEVQGWFKEAGFPEPKYINAWPYCPPEEKYRVPGFKDSFRLGQLLGVIAKREGVAEVEPIRRSRAASA